MGLEASCYGRGARPTGNGVHHGHSFAVARIEKSGQHGQTFTEKRCNKRSRKLLEIRANLAQLFNKLSECFPARFHPKLG